MDDFAVGRDGADLGNFSRRGDLGGARLQVRDDFFDGQVDTALQVHRVHAGSDGLDAFVDDGLAENGGGGGAVTGDVVGLGGHGAQHLGAHVFELVFEFDFLGDGDAVLGDARSAEALLDDDVTALGAQGHLDRIGQDIDAAQHLVASIGGELNFFGSHVKRSLGLNGETESAEAVRA